MKEEFEAAVVAMHMSHGVPECDALTFLETGHSGYTSVSTKAAWWAWQEARKDSEPMLKARRELDDAVHAMTDSLDYEWTGDFRPEIEQLNGAYMRFSVINRRARKAIAKALA